jgi:PKD repeat protein
LTVPDQYDEIQFTDDTLGAVEWHWDFGDGFTSHEQNPTHVYPGGAGSKYTVKLTVRDNNDKVGIAVKTDYIQVQNDSYIADKLSSPELIISAQNKVRSNQTIAFTVVEHDTGSYNTLDVGYDSNDEVDSQLVSNWLSNNGYTDAYVLNFRGDGDAIIAEETTAANRLRYQPGNQQFQGGTPFNATCYEIQTNLTLNKPYYQAVYIDQQASSAIRFLYDNNSGHLYYQNARGMVDWDLNPNINIRCGATLPNTGSGYHLIEGLQNDTESYLRVDSVETLRNIDQGNKDSPITHLFYLTNDQHFIQEIALSNDFENKYLSYVKHEYNTNF